MSPLADRVHVVAAGIDCYGFANEQRVHAVADGAEGLELATSLARPVELALERHRLASTFALRAARPEELWEPVVLVTPGGDRVGRDRPEERPTELGGRGLAVLTGDASGAWRLVLEGLSWRLEPLGETVVPQVWPPTSSPTSAPCSSTRPPSRWRSASGLTAGHRRGLRGAPMGPLVRVLGPVDVIDATGRAVFERAKALELAVWLAEHRHRPTRSSASSRPLGERCPRRHLRQRRVRRPPGDGAAGRTTGR